MNTIGVSCPDFSKEPFADMLKTISKDFAHWEIFSELAHYGPMVVSTSAEAVKGSAMTFSLHTGIADINVASLNGTVREACVRSILAEMESAYELGIDTVTIHPGLVNLAVHDVRQRSLDAARLSMREFDRAAREYGIHACIENMPDIPIMICQSASELEQVIDGTSLEVCFDIGHANTAGQIDAMIDLFRDRIANIHIHDNLGDRDAHLTIGDGNIDFGHVLGRLKGYARRYIIECRNLDSARVSLARLKDMLQ